MSILIFNTFFKAARKLLAVASVSTQSIAVNRELGDGEPQVMDVDVQSEFHFIQLNALTGTQINSNNKTKTAENSQIGILGVFLLLELTSIFTCSLYLLFFFYRGIAVGTGGLVGGRNEMPQHSTALLSPSNSPTHLGWPFHFREQQMER